MFMIRLLLSLFISLLDFRYKLNCHHVEKITLFVGYLYLCSHLALALLTALSENLMNFKMNALMMNS